MKLHDYQERAIDFDITKKIPFHAIDLGLGKTIIKLKAIEKLGIPALVIAPINTMYNTWPDEIKKWGIKCTYDILHGPNKNLIYRDTNADILLLNYHGIDWFYKTLMQSKKHWKKRLLVLDESSMIKSVKVKRFKTLRKMFPLFSEYRSCLSATPSPNGYHELWPQYFMLDKGQRLFSSYYQYRGNFFNYMGPPVYKTSILPGAHKVIEERVRDITFRLDAKDYLKMPEIIYNEINLELPSKLYKQYQTLENDFLLEFDTAISTAFSAAALSNKLRQFIQGALYTDTGGSDFYPIHMLKIEALKELMETNVGKPILCPIQFKFERRMINVAFNKDIPCIAGGTSVAQARSYIKAWNDGNIPLLLCHPASLGHGVNLQSGGHIVLWYGLPWSLELYKQLNGRIYRQGQTHAVIVHHLIIKNTVDERIVKVLQRKDATQQMFLNALRR